MHHRVRGARLVDRAAILVQTLRVVLLQRVHLRDVLDPTLEVQLQGQGDGFCCGLRLFIILLITRLHAHRRVYTCAVAWLFRHLAIAGHLQNSKDFQQVFWAMWPSFTR